jgi:hypothetical protein
MSPQSGLLEETDLMETMGMSVGERRRLELLSRVRDGALSLSKAAESMGVSYRQAKRIWSRYRSEGDAGLVHRLRGRASNRRSDESRRKPPRVSFLRQSSLRQSLGSFSAGFDVLLSVAMFCLSRPEDRQVGDVIARFAAGG